MFTGGNEWSSSFFTALTVRLHLLDLKGTTIDRVPPDSSGFSYFDDWFEIHFDSESVSLVQFRWMQICDSWKMLRKTLSVRRDCIKLWQVRFEQFWQVEIEKHVQLSPNKTKIMFSWTSILKLKTLNLFQKEFWSILAIQKLELFQHETKFLQF